MDELDLGMECLEEDASLCSASPNHSSELSPAGLEGEGKISLDDLAVVSKIHTFDESPNAKLPSHYSTGSMPRPGSVEIASDGSKVTRKGRLTIYVGSAVEQHRESATHCCATPGAGKPHGSSYDVAEYHEQVISDSDS
jgi:hypothetical protein